MCGTPLASDYALSDTSETPLMSIGFQWVSTDWNLVNNFVDDVQNETESVGWQLCQANRSKKQ